jgi:nuclear cap-binding protein subunit 1
MSRINKQLEPICGPDDYDAHDRRRESLESPEQMLKNTIIKLGEVVSPVFLIPIVIVTDAHDSLFQDAIQELPRLAKQIREQVPLSVPAISEGIRIA